MGFKKYIQEKLNETISIDEAAGSISKIGSTIFRIQKNAESQIKNILSKAKKIEKFISSKGGGIKSFEWDMKGYFNSPEYELKIEFDDNLIDKIYDLDFVIDRNKQKVEIEKINKELKNISGDNYASVNGLNIRG